MLKRWKQSSTRKRKRRSRKHNHAMRFFDKEDSLKMKYSEPTTCLYGSETARKDDPQIMLRGEIDSLLAYAVDALAFAKERLEQTVACDLKDIVCIIQKVMSAEACSQPVKIETILGLSLEELREYSCHPQKYLQTKHIFPGEDWDRITSVLNILRTKVRQTECICIAAGLDAYANESIQKILNRLSSAVYIIMLKHSIK